jgi:hypothetical protein
MAFDKVEPFGAWAADARHGAALHLHASLASEKNAKALKPTDFALGSWAKPRPLTDEEQALKFEAWLASKEEK